MEYPLTLAEVLFEELGITCADIDESQMEIEVVFTEVEDRGLAIIRAITTGTDWDGVEEEIDQIRALPEYNQTELQEMCEREGLDVDLSVGDPYDVIWKCKKELSSRLVPILYQIIRNLPQRRSALCLSGGGVRSAVFNLGILQGLARCGLLDKFDYLSTVSGGGFIGGWLSAWIHREKENVPPQSPVNKVAGRMAKAPDDPLKPEPDSVYNLRVYANYLTPRKGLLSVDTWTLVAVYLRNLVLTWMVFLPAIMAFLMLPRIWVAFVKSPHLGSYRSSMILLGVGFAGAVFALAYIGTNLPSAKTWNVRESRFLALCLVPLVISAMALTTYWFRFHTEQKLDWWDFTRFALALGALSWAICILLILFARRRDRKADDGDEVEHRGNGLRILGFYALGTFLILLAFALSGAAVWYVVTTQLPQSPEVRLYASLAVPLLLILLTVGGTLIAGFTSRFTDVDDQEWWARSGAWILIVVVGWSLFHLLVLFGPALFVELQNLLVQKNWTWASTKGVGTALVGIVSGAITLLGGSSSKTPANGEQDPEADWKAKVLSIGTSVAAVVFGSFILIVLALATNWILASSLGESAGRLLGGGVAPLSANDPKAIIYNSPGRLLAVIAALIVIVGWLFGRLINTNRFSLHYYWRNRLMRAYLGASRKRAKTKNKFTDFDRADNVQMYELKQKPLHVVNVTLNLVGGDKLEWQDRKAESFSISPLHSGSYWLGYRNSRNYGGANGISLATAAALSGAAASPNMGYMMTSPVVRFIMTLFNVRLGFWLGNPGVAGSGGDSTTLNRPTFDRDSPRQSVRPIFAEALGLTDSRSPYVYLSDGGHFDNFGLYEMILRRCRFIVISDASTDPDYCFESLAYAIRQVRVDFGVPIEFRDKMHLGKNPADPNKYCAIADIRYSCVDKPHGPSPNPAYDGVLIYIKPSLAGSESADVLNFRKGDKAFPQDTIVDQWFSEPQFESYRMLGSHMIQTICPKKVGDSPHYFEKFEELAKQHLRQDEAQE